MLKVTSNYGNLHRLVVKVLTALTRGVFTKWTICFSLSQWQQGPHSAWKSIRASLDLPGHWEC